MKLREGQIPADKRGQLVEALQRLVQLYEIMEKPDEATKWRGELEATKIRLASPQQ